MNESVLIVGAGNGLSASLAQLCASKGMKVVLAARNIEKLQNLKKIIGADTIRCDATNIKSVTTLFKKTDKIIGAPNLVIYNPSKSLGGSIVDLDPKKAHEAIDITCYGGFLVAQQAAKRMLKRLGPIISKRITSSKHSYWTFYYRWWYWQRKLWII